MQLELHFKKEYVCKIPSRRLKHFRHILLKDNEPAHFLHQVTYVTASDIKKKCNKLADLLVFSYNQKKQTNNETYSSTANIFLTIFTLVLISKFSP